MVMHNVLYKYKYKLLVNKLLVNTENWSLKCYWFHLFPLVNHIR